MPRDTQQRVTSIAAPDAISNPERGVVPARRVDMGFPTAPGGDMTALLQGLSQFNGAISRYIDKKNEQDLNEGAAAQSVGAPQDTSKSLWWQHGHMVMEGRAAGQSDAVNGLYQDYLTKFDKDNGNLNAFIADQYQQRTKGLQPNDPYLTGYQQTFGKMADELRTAHQKWQAGVVAEKQQANMQSEVDQTIRSFTDNGVPVELKAFDPLKQQFKKAFGTSYADFNEMLFESAKALGDAGNPTVYAMWKRKNEDGTYGDKTPDGTPGMYNIPKWRDKIDAAEAHATQVYVANQDRARTLEAKDRADRQDIALYSVFKMVPDDPQGAKVAFDKLVSDGLFNRASDLTKWRDMLTKADTRAAREDQKVTQTQLQAGIYTADVGIRQILAADLTPDQKQMLMSEWYQKKNDDTKNSHDRQNSLYNNMAFKSQDDFIEKQLAPQQDLFGKFNNRNDFIKGAQASAKLELVEYVQQHGLQKLREKALEIVKRHQQRISDFDATRLDLSAKMLRYSTPQEAWAARQRGDLAGSDYALHVEYFKNQALRQQPKPTRSTDGSN